jgi:hypothetical protein
LQLAEGFNIFLAQFQGLAESVPSTLVRIATFMYLQAADR